MGEIAGVFCLSETFSRHYSLQDKVEMMLEAVKRKEPERRNFFTSAAFCVGINKSESEDHEFRAEDTCITAIYEGDIGNIEFLRDLVIKKGHKLWSDEPAEVLMHLYEDAGCDFAELVDGKFLIVICDERERKLVLADDRIGTKSLYYMTNGNRFVFASKIKGIIAFPDEKRQVDPHAVLDFFITGEISPSGTLLKGVSRLEPGSILIIDGKTAKIQQMQYFTPKFGDYQEGDALATRSLLTQLKGVINAKMSRLEPPFFAYLSGGLDSTSIAYIMQLHAGQPIRTISTTFEQGVDETPFALLASKAIGTQHKVERIEPSEYIDALKAVIWISEEIKVSDNSVAFFFGARSAQKDAKTIFSGSGADELLAGYTHFLDLRISSIIHSFVHEGRLTLRDVKEVTVWIKSRLKKGRERGGFVDRSTILPLTSSLPFVLLEGFDCTLAERLKKLFAMRRIKALFTEAFLWKVRKHNLYDTSKGSLACKDPFENHRCYRIRVKLPRLAKIESECHRLFSVRVEYPFLDSRVLDASLRIPPCTLVRDHETKHVLRVILHSYGVPDLITKKPKTGFCAPLESWLRIEPLLSFSNNLLLDSRTKARGYFNQLYVKRILQEHLLKERDHTALIGALINFEIWCRLFVDGDKEFRACV